MNPASNAICLAIWIASLTSCTVHDALSTLQPTDFISHSESLEKSKNTPFSLVWVSPDARTRMYDTLVVEAVRIDKMDPHAWRNSMSTFIPTRAEYEQRVEELGNYLQESVSTRFETDNPRDEPVNVRQELPVQQLPLVDPIPHTILPVAPIDLIDPPPRTLRIQISLSEANFGDPIIYGGLLAVPVPAIANASTAVQSPSLTLEVRFVDQESGAVLMEIVDRRFPQLKIVDVNRLTVSRPLNEIADSFAVDLVKSFYRKPGEKVRGRLPFSLLPW